MASVFYTVFSWIQFAVLAYFFSGIIRNLQFYFLYFSDLSQYKPTSGGEKAWALVTGASDGIGKAFAEELCRRGFNVVIHGRNEKKLKGVKAELEKEFSGSEVRLLVIDAANTPWSSDIDALVLKAVKGVNLTILINNVGGAAGLEWEPLKSYSPATLNGLINLNAVFMAQITRVLIPTLAQSQSQKATIVNVSSGAELLPAAYLVAYSASKAFVSRWSRGLDAELKAEGLKIEVQSLIVGAVETPGSGMSTNQDLFTPTANTMAVAALSKFGSNHGVVVTPYWRHGMQVLLMTNMPNFVGVKFMVDMAKRQRKIAEEKKKGK